MLPDVGGEGGTAAVVLMKVDEGVWELLLVELASINILQNYDGEELREGVVQEG